MAEGYEILHGLLLGIGIALGFRLVDALLGMVGRGAGPSKP